MKLKAVLDFKMYPECYGKLGWKLIEPVLSELYITCYNFYATKFEYGPVNDEWDRLHPEITGMEDGSAELKEYNRFVAERATKWVDENINAVLPDNIPMRFYVSSDEVVFTGYDLNNKECEVSMHLEPIKDPE